MNYIISIINPNAHDTMAKICSELNIPIVLSTRGHGTATKNMRDLLGIESTEKNIFITVTTEEITREFIKAQKKRLYIDAPGNGILIAVPIKSVGGGKTLAFLGGNNAKMKAPVINYDYELITVIANEGFTDNVMDAARSAGAKGGTVIHAKGTGGQNAEKFFKVSIAQEKDMIFILVKADEKTAIMKSILTLVGPGTPAGALVFSSPVSHVEGFSLTEDADVIEIKDKTKENISKQK